MARLLGVSVASLSNWALDGELTPLRPGGYAKYRVAETRQHLAKALGDPDPGDLKQQTANWIMRCVDQDDIGAIWMELDYLQRRYGKKYSENVSAFLDEHLTSEQLQRYRDAVKRNNQR